MKKRILALAFLAMMATPLLGGAKLVLRPDGMGRVRIGMTLPQLNRLLHDKMEPPDGADVQYCYLTSPAKFPKVSFMFEEGRLSRIGTRGVGVATAEGIQVGDSETRAKQVYGRRLIVEDAKYDDDGHFLTIFTPNKKYGIRFTTHKGKIVEIYVGRAESIQYVEDCL